MSEETPPEGDAPDPTELGPVIEALTRQLGIHVPQHTSNEERELYARMLNARCACCGHALEAKTHAIVNELGVVLIFCGGPCLQDFTVHGWLEEEYDKIAQQIKIRSKQGEMNEEAQDDGE